MPALIHNLQPTEYMVPILPGPLTLQPAGNPDDNANCTSELSAPPLTNEQYAALQALQASGLILFTKTADITISTPGLVIQSATNVVDDSKAPRAASMTPASPVYFDSFGKGLKTIIVKASDGAFELEVWGSIDVAQPDTALKVYKFLGDINGSDPGLYQPDDELVSKLRGYRFLKVDLHRGVPPVIQFQSTDA